MNKKDFINKVFITNGFKDTQKLGQGFAKSLQAGDVICLYGNLGSGKTTFVQGMAKGLGIKQRIISPTFLVVRSYELGVMNFYHIDLHRTENEKDIRNLGFEEIISNSQNIVVIEWAEKAETFLPKKRINIKFFHEGNETRKVAFGLTT